MRRGDQIFARRSLNRLPAVHHINTIGPFAQHLQIMADQNDGRVVVLVQPVEQAENLRLGGRLHGVGRLIGNQQTRLVGQRNGDHHFLTLALRQLIRETAHRIFMIFNADAVQQLNRPAFAPAHALPPLAFKGPARDVLHQLLADPLGGIETGLRLLKNHRHVVAQQLAPLARREAHQVDIIKAHTVRRDAPVILGNATDRFRNQALTRS